MRVLGPPVRRLPLVPAALIVLFFITAVVPAKAAPFRTGFTEELSPACLEEALGRGDLEAARSMILLRSALVPVTINTLMDAAIEADLASRAAAASVLWEQIARLAALYLDVSDDEFYVGYVARYRRLGLDRKAVWIQARDASRRAREHRRKGEIDLFRKALDESVSLWRELGDRRSEADGVLELCYYLQRGVEGYEALLDCWARASDLYLEAGDIREYAASRVMVSLAQNDLGRYADGLETLQHANAIFKSLRDDHARMYTLGDMGWLLTRLNEFEPALAAYDEATEIAVHIEDRYWESQLLMQKGSVYENAAAYDKANVLYLRSLAIREELGAEPDDLIPNLGTNYFNLGLYLKSLRFMHRFLRDVKGNKDGEAYAYWIIAQNYEALNDWEMAETSYGRLIGLARQTGGKRNLLVGLTRLALVQSQIGKVPEAERALREVLEILAELPSNAKSLTELEQVAERYKAMGKPEQAHELYARVASEAARVGAKAELAEAHVSLGTLAVEAHDLAAARKHIIEAFGSLSQLDDLSGRAMILLRLASLQEAVGDAASALATYRRGLQEYEPFITTSFEAGEPENWPMVRRSYERLIALLQQARDTEGASASRDESFQLAQRFQALGLRQLLAKGKLLARDEASAELVEREKTVLQELSTAQRELARAADPEGRRVLVERVHRIEDEHELIRAQLRVHRRPLADSGSLRALSLEQTQGALDGGTAVLQYFLGEEHAFLWILTRGDAVMLQLPPAKEIEEAVRFYVKGVSSRASRDTYEEASDELFSMLLEHAVPHLPGITSLLVIPDGVLHLLPFEALASAGSQSPLLSRYSVGYLPAMSLLLAGDDGVRRSGSDKRAEVLLVADPWIEPRRTGGRTQLAELAIPDELTERGFYERGGFDFRPLTHARGEVSGIARILKGRASISLLAGKQATEETIKSLEVSRFSVLHFATHALLDETVPMRSAVVLSLDEEGGEDGFLQMREIFNLNLDADLVVLSGCETGRGKLLKGEGLVGLPRAFLAAGARSLVVSLWRVNDRSTSLLMEVFYRNLKEGMGKAEALNQAKLSLMNAEKGRYAHPYYWAPFILIGDHR